MKNLISFEEILKQEYGEKGSPERDAYDAESLAFRLGVRLKEARKRANITQERLAEITGTPKNEISQIERGCGDVPLSVYSRLIQMGLGKGFDITVC